MTAGEPLGRETHLDFDFKPAFDFACGGETFQSVRGFSKWSSIANDHSLKKEE